MSEHISLTGPRPSVRGADHGLVDSNKEIGAQETIRQAFGSITFLIGWRIWKERNSRTFGGAQTTAAALAQQILDEIDIAVGGCWLQAAGRSGGASLGYSHCLFSG